MPNNEVTFRNLNEAGNLAEVTENTKVVVLENGVTKQTDVSNFINNPFIIDFTKVGEHTATRGYATTETTYEELQEAKDNGRYIMLNIKEADIGDPNCGVLQPMISGDGGYYGFTGLNYSSGGPTDIRLIVARMVKEGDNSIKANWWIKKIALSD